MTGGGPLAIRRLVAGDVAYAAPVTALVNRAYLPATAEVFTASLERVRHSEVLAAIRQGELLVGERNGRLVAVVQLQWADTETVFWGMLAVDPADARTGIANSLLDYAEAEVVTLGGRRMEMDVILPDPETPHQGRLLRWYARRGYREVSRKRWVVPPEIAGALISESWYVRLRKDLTLSRGG